MNPTMMKQICGRCHETWMSCMCEQFHPNTVATAMPESTMSVMINDVGLAEIWKKIDTELGRAEKLHPNYTTDTLRRTAITVEEGLEAIHEMAHRLEALQKATLEVTRVSTKGATMDNLEMELVQTAATCIRHLRALVVERK